MTKEQYDDIVYAENLLVNIMHDMEDAHKDYTIRKRLDTIIGKMDNIVNDYIMANLERKPKKRSKRKSR